MDSNTTNNPKKDTFTEYYNLPNPVCINKFAWTTIHLSVGESMSCHRVRGDVITPETYGNFHNTPSKIKDRELMLQGQWPTTNGPYPKQAHSGCEVCREIETAGGVSERQMMNENYGLHEIVPKETKENSNSIITTPTILEVFFNNQCNMSCIYCTPKFSSSIAAECFRYKDRLDELDDVLTNRKDYKNLLDAHFNWMKENARYLHRYAILGGEPFYQSELEQNLDFFINNKCPNLTITIFSNLKVEKERFKNLLNKISFLIKNKHVYKIELICSFDCWGPQIEYIRHGVSLTQWEENFNIILNEYPDISLIIHSTLTALTFDTFPDLCNKINEYIKIRPIKHSISTVDGRPYLYPGIFSKRFYSEKIDTSIKSYQSIIKTIINETDYIEKPNLIKSYHEVIAQLKGYEKTFNAHALDKENIKELKKYLDTLDFRRKTDWKKLWPWLDNYPT